MTTPHGRLDYADLPSAYGRWPSFPMISISQRQRRPLRQGELGRQRSITGCRSTVSAARQRRRPDGEPLSRLPRPAVARQTSGPRHRDRPPSRAEAEDRGQDRRRRSRLFPRDDRAADRRRPGRICRRDRRGEKADFLGKAAALLFPIDWPEPFGLVVIEAMAVGTPVIVWKEGAMPEIVDEGVTGFVVDSIDEAVAAVPRLAAARPASWCGQSSSGASRPSEWPATTRPSSARCSPPPAEPQASSRPARA